MKKRILCLLLALALCVGACPVGAGAADVPTPTVPAITIEGPLTKDVVIDTVQFSEDYEKNFENITYSRTAVTPPDLTNLVFRGTDGKYYTAPESTNTEIEAAMGENDIKWYRGVNLAADVQPMGSVPMDVDSYTLQASVTVTTKDAATPDAADKTVTRTCKMEFSISPIMVEPVLRTDIKKPYDGTAGYNVTAGPTPFNKQASHILQADEDEVNILAEFHFADSSVGTKQFNATQLDLSGTRSGNYAIAPGFTVTPVDAEIVKAKVPSAANDTLLVRNRQKRTYVYNLKNLLPALSGSMSYGAVTYKIVPPIQADIPAFFPNPSDLEKDIRITGDNKDQLTIDIAAANHDGANAVGVVHLQVSSKNFETFDATLSINSDDRTPVKITGLEAMERTPYDGKEQQGYSGKAGFKLVLSDGTLQDLPADTDNDPADAPLDKVYRATGRSPSGEYGPTATPPTEPGEYTVTLSIPNSNPDYAGDWTGTFTITKAKVTVKALERRIKIDDPIPQFKNPQLGVDYEVTGLAEGDKLKIPPTMKYATVADSIMEGEFEILIDGAMVPDNTHYDAAIEYKPGKLIVSSLSKDDNPFSDVSEYAWYVTAVKYVYNKGLMKGVTSTLFDPTGDLTRGMLVTILYRLDGEWPVWQTMPFTDLNPNAYYMDAVRWASANKIVQGYGDGRFGPDDVLTREQLAIILYNYARFSGHTPNKAASLDHFVDAYYTTAAGYRALQWTCAEGLIQGTGSTTISPTDPALRAQVAVIFMRYCTNILGK